MIGLELFEQEFDHLKFIRITYMESSGVVQDFSEPGKWISGEAERDAPNPIARIQQPR